MTHTLFNSATPLLEVPQTHMLTEVQESINTKIVVATLTFVFVFNVLVFESERPRKRGKHGFVAWLIHALTERALLYHGR